MKATKTLTRRATLNRKYHALLSNQNDPDFAKQGILDSFNVSSSRDLSDDQLEEACHRLALWLKPSTSMMDKWRKRLMASIGGWLKAMNKTGNAAVIKAIACRASGKQDFNKIPFEQLRSLYNAFLKKQHDLNAVDELTEIELDLISIAN